MASTQKSHEERAQSAAQQAADELRAASRQEQDHQQVGEEEAPVRHAADAAMGKAGEMKDAAADTARGAMDAAADKARGVRDAAADRTTGNSKAGDDDEAGWEEEDVMLRVKEADQMTGQGFNDVGPMGEEGTGVPRRRRSSS